MPDCVNIIAQGPLLYHITPRLSFSAKSKSRLRLILVQVVVSRQFKKRIRPLYETSLN